MQQDPMHTDIDAMNGLLRLAATGRAFLWSNPQSKARIGYRAIERVRTEVFTDVATGRNEYRVTVFAADMTLMTLVESERKLADAFAQAYAALKTLPLAADVVASVHIGPAANDAVPPAAEGVA